MQAGLGPQATPLSVCPGKCYWGGGICQCRVQVSKQGRCLQGCIPHCCALVGASGAGAMVNARGRFAKHDCRLLDTIHKPNFLPNVLPLDRYREHCRLRQPRTAAGVGRYVVPLPPDGLAGEVTHAVRAAEVRPGPLAWSRVPCSSSQGDRP